MAATVPVKDNFSQRESRPLRRHRFYKFTIGIDMQQTAGVYGMNEIKTIKFEARPVGMSEKTAERLSGEGSSDEKRWLRYPDAVRILNRYAVSVIKEASQQFIENATSFNHQNTDEASLRREARNYMRQAAECACLLKNRARLFGKSSPIARTLDGSVMEDILLDRKSVV